MLDCVVEHPHHGAIAPCDLQQMQTQTLGGGARHLDNRLIQITKRKQSEDSTRPAILSGPRMMYQASLLSLLNTEAMNRKTPPRKFPSPLSPCQFSVQEKTFHPRIVKKLLVMTLKRNRRS